ncbi:MAG: UDP-glucose 6-dehydrogenase, partial [Actinobacteria bacterium]|nr:UDP-glucose 6-dehydrogenase [Actinomycetota bacterium]
MSPIAVIGAEYVGLPTAACMAYLGHTVCCAHVSGTRIRALNAGALHNMEDGLAELLRQGLASVLLSFSSDNKAAVTVDRTDLALSLWGISSHATAIAAGRAFESMPVRLATTEP